MSVNNIYKLLPLFVFWFIWALQVLLYKINPLGFYYIHQETWIIITLSIITVSVGFLTVYYLYLLFPSKIDLSHHREEVTLSLFHLYKTISIVSFFSIILLLFFLAEKYGGLPNLILNPVELRHLVTDMVRNSAADWDVKFSILNYLISLNYPAALLGGYLVINARKSKLWGFFPLLNALLFSLLTMQRYNFIFIITIWAFSIVISLIIYQKSDKNIKVKRFIYSFIASTVFIFSLLLAVIFLRIDYGGKEINIWLTLKFALSSIYTYIAGNIVAFDKFILKDPILMNGTSIFRGFIKWFSRLGIYDSALVQSTYNEFVNIGSKSLAVNTFTYLRPFYEDYGLIGLLILNYMFGALGALSIEELFKKFSFVRLHFAAYFFFAYFLSFFTFVFLSLTMFLYFTFLVFLVQKYYNIKIRYYVDIAS